MNAGVSHEEILNDPHLSYQEKIVILEKLREIAKLNAEELEKSLSPTDNGRKQKDTARKGSVPQPLNIPNDQQDNKENDSTFVGIESDDCDSDDGDKYIRIAKQTQKRKLAKKKVFDWKQVHSRNCHREQMVNREVHTILTMLNSNGSSESLQLLRLEKDMERARQKFKMDMRKQINKTQTSVALMCTHVNKMGSGDQYMMKLQELMETAEGNISGTKHGFRLEYEKLLREEQEYTKLLQDVEVQFMEMEEEDRRMKEMKREVNRVENKLYAREATVVAPQISNQRGDKSNLKQEILTIDRSIAELGGVREHWDERDHASFLQLVSRFKLNRLILTMKTNDECTEEEKRTINRFVEKVGSILPMQDEGSIRQHIVWYGKYQRLLERKRELVKDWKSRKAIEKATFMNSTIIETNKTSGLNVKTTKQLRNERLKMKKERDDKHRAIQEWRKEKAFAEKLKQDRTKQQMEHVKEIELKRKLEREKNKEGIEIYRLEKAAQKLSKRANEAFATTKKGPTKSDLQALQQRDRLIVQKRLADKKATEKESRFEKTSRLVARGVPKVSRDSNRILRPTHANLHQRLTDEEIAEQQQRRRTQGAHDRVVPSTFGAERSGKSYCIGVRHMVSGRAQATWRSRR